MIDEIREYIKQRVACVDADLKMDKQPIASGTIPTIALESTYTVKFGSFSIDRQDTHLEVRGIVNMEIFKKLSNDLLNNYDKAFLRALDIYANISDQMNINQVDYIKTINNGEITPDAVDSDNNTAKFNLQFNIVLIFAIA